MARKKTDKIEKTSYDKMLDFVSDELSVAKRNQDPIFDNFDDYYKMLHCVSLSDMQDIPSDLFLPEFVARTLSIIGDFVAKYFSSRDYVDNYSNSADPRDVKEAKASKTLLNTLLNTKDMFYFHKIVRAMMFVSTCGYSVIKGSYNQQTKQVKTGSHEETIYLKDDEGNPIDEEGSLFEDEFSQTMATTQEEVDDYEDKVIVDRPDFDVFPNHDVYTSSEYAYSLNYKRWVIFRTYKTLSDLEEDAAICGYFNLDKLREYEKKDTVEAAVERGRSKHIVDYGEDDEPEPEGSVKTYQVYERWGKFPVIVKERDENDKPTKVEPGFDKNGKVDKTAEYIECIISWVATKSQDNPLLVIRCQASPYSRRPMCRFLCYIDSLEDRGFGDAEFVKGSVMAINDTLNISNYRVRLATTPAFKSKRATGIPPKIKVSPQGSIELENLDDLVELKIEDNVQGALQQIGLLSSGMDRAMSVSPVRMGAEGDRRETATVGAMIDQNANIRAGLRTTTLEFVGFSEFYDMMLSLVNDFMLPETLINLIGQDLASAYNPDREDHFIPVSQSLETEQSKRMKMSTLDQLIGRVVAFPNPKTPMVVNYLMGMWLELAGGDFKHFKRYMFEEDPETNLLYQIVTGGKAQTAAPTPNGPTEGAPSNEQGIAQGGMEQMVRGMMGGQ
jgi:hypothetical protein